MSYAGQKEKNMAKEPSLREMLEAGVHFGHKTSRWHPKMAPYIHSKRQDAHIIDLTKTVDGLNKALDFISKTTASGKQVMFVGTKKQAKEVVKEVAESVNQPYVTERWIGGMLTNSNTVNQQIKKLKNLEKRMESGELEKRYSKLEVQRYQEDIDALNLKYSGMKELRGKPGALIVMDANVDLNAIKEANTLGIPVVALVDTNVNPDKVDYVIPANDDAIKGIQLLLSYFKEAVVEGAGLHKKEDKKVEKKEG